MLHKSQVTVLFMSVGKRRFRTPDLCGALKKLMKPVELTDDAFALDVIKEMGTDGNYLMEEHTVARCRDEFYVPDMSARTVHNQWLEMVPRDLTQRAGNLEQRLTGYEKPDFDPAIEKQLVQYVNQRKLL